MAPFVFHQFSLFMLYNLSLYVICTRKENKFTVYDKTDEKRMTPIIDPLIIDDHPYNWRFLKIPTVNYSEQAVYLIFKSV